MVFFPGLSGKGRSSGTLESLSGVIERWISNKAEGRHRRSRDARLSEPWKRTLNGQRNGVIRRIH
jgi:hypothetical protein